jgi:hypothetical protein
MNVSNVDATPSSETRTEARSAPVGNTVRTRETQTSANIGTALIESKETAVLFSPQQKRAERDVSLQALYPHWDEVQAEAALTVRQVTIALSDIERAVEAVAVSETAAALNCLALSESSLFNALSTAAFNRALYSIVSFAAWALRNITEAQLGITPLQGMAASLREIKDKPFIDFNRSAEIAAELESLGWDGESPITNAFMGGLVAEAGMELPSVS